MEILEEKSEDLTISEKQSSYSSQIKGNVTFNKVHFAYESRPDLTILKGVSFSANSGEQIAIVGSSGSGKSTISALLLRFYEPTEGSIIIDGISADQYALQDLRSEIAVVPQEVLLFGGSIKENIAYGKPQATEDEILDAASKANAMEFIEKFPEKLNTLIGDRGVQLSGGQRQRIAIARAVLKNPSILILDEATSSLDSGSESLVQQALERIMIGRTTFVIAHRLSTVRKATEILVLEDGQIIEEGKHEELIIKENGVYKNLSALQFEES